MQGRTVFDRTIVTVWRACLPPRSSEMGRETETRIEGMKGQRAESSKLQDCAAYGMGGAIHSTTVLRAHWHWQWQKCNLVSCEGNRLDLHGMPHQTLRDS